ncbi:1-(5-phosphoribosyl)-5-[(5-phosphoribosylamino)methylideneamino]imidazole-4-carboxamide isomerase [Parvularcula sp. IMCC14364]|uniref:1-(5-phosphoribosyl)-5-[(5- phosphoribosylamino)methylideneamino]imidazole-4- carboxamide isomerase n=1 Tax=Parvularcula sp. IMCC14364 TaxID=3067902 RepID=UPI0027411176|nr:1-(5-phosphoribosyl)-5-[(5-phosphoribosylamino)methylideneamino]imidazole-4-carboxamide isomerase [Parvularcula sp. IMCC14364]
MLIYPAIDLIDGKCVRLAQGSFDAVTHYDDKPADRLAAFVRDGARQVHIVDLDGARSGAPVQHQLIGNLATSAGVIVQAAGGVRTEAHVASLLDSGVSRVVIGSLAVLDKDRVLQWLEKYGGEKFTISLDVKIQDDEPIIATHGWEKSSGEILWDTLSLYAAAGLQHLLVTDVARDGMLSGPNLELMTSIIRRFPNVSLQASGGVGTLEDIVSLKEAGATAAIVGKAIYEGRFTLPEAINAGA